jgi:hypothetical protein
MCTENRRLNVGNSVFGFLYLLFLRVDENMVVHDYLEISGCTQNDSGQNEVGGLMSRYLLYLAERTVSGLPIKKGENVLGVFL